jgi:hypothetical protein
MTAILGRVENSQSKILQRNTYCRLWHRRYIAATIKVSLRNFKRCRLFYLEPYGLTQMHALKYGTVPIVSSFDGIDGSIKYFNGKTGTGFKFAPNNRKLFLQL